jgi:hypothetical protein
MRQVKHVVGTTVIDGRPYEIVRNYFINDDKKNYLKQAQSYFTKDEKKIAKANYKLNK